MNKKITIDKIKVIVFLLIFLVNESTIQFGTIDNNLLIRIGQFSIIIFLTYFLLTVRKTYGNMNLLAIIISICVIITMFIMTDFQLNYLLSIVLIWCGLFFVYKISFDKFIYCFDDCLYFFAICSLFSTLIMLIFPSIIRMFPVVTNLSGEKFYNLFVCMIPTNFSTYRYRNYGIFREPGVYQFYICLGILFQIYRREGMNIKRTIIYIIALVSTLSTTGYFLGVVLLGLYLFKREEISNRRKIIVLLLSVVLVIYLFLYTDLLSMDGVEYSVFRKMQGVGDFFSGGENLSASLVVRFGSVVVDTVIFLKNPLLGVGMKGLYELYPRISLDYFNYALKYPSDSFILQYAKYGLVTGMIFTVGYFLFSKKISDKPIEKVIIFVFIVLELMTENYSGFILIYVLFWYGIENSKLLHNS